MSDEKRDVQIKTATQRKEEEAVVIRATEDRKTSVADILASRSSLRVDPRLIQFNKTGVLGRGGKGDVHLGILKRSASAPEEMVAVKQLRPDSEMNMEKFAKAFSHEVDLLADLSHPNIVKLIGFVEDMENDKAWVILPWESNGNVREFLASGEWEIPERVSLLSDTFEGLKYLHTRQPPICHGDLKSLNILVSSTFRATITDFGSARFRRKVSEAHHGASQDTAPIPTAEEFATSAPITLITSETQLTLTGPAWSLRWAAPEILLEDDVDLPSDIWAAGWVAWEIMTNQIPFADTNSPGVITLKVVRGEFPSIRDDADLSQIIRLGSIMMDCWSFDPKSRPTASECSLKLWYMPRAIPSGGDLGTSKVRSTELLLRMASIHSSQGRNESATSLLEQALAIAQPADDKRATATVFRSLAYIHLARSKYSEAEDLFIKALDITTDLNDSDLDTMNALQGLGEIYRLTERPLEAEQSFLKVKDICTRIGDPIGKNNALRGLGDVYRARGRYAEAEESYMQAKDICFNIGHYIGLTNALNGLGHVYRLTERYVEAEQSFIQAKDACARTGDGLTEGNVLRGLGNVSNAQSKYTEAIGWFTQAEAVSGRVGDNLGRAHSLAGLGTAYLGQKKYKESEQSFAQAEELYIRLGYKTGRANVLLGFGNLRREEAKYSDASAFYTEARDIYGLLGRAEAQMEASELVDTVKKESERASLTLPTPTNAAHS